ncbi:HEAT repeat domain-containing protein [Methanoculleus sp. YWC-01]|jgi:HEAT repeat protein|uniref:HEAT repeat domain-containing protein n=1 Tax=Methanoculleus nereidis TaxID=2735141 RepID=A0ABU3Z1S6_9EURY|nr:HEAT repeat domain-containing protein [Methanoculleus sp. YWC-01]MCK9298154.1 HEAT repeat domain-containing protein [Methanoculleus sp.]MDV4342769.1 HEAT repeat domain-containing protein [Methanoculleus sp. YWC-01]PKL56888.1 MAG: HEAT repeat domain-containing protein [Methanomicrobiales archaeon HGW-Methanomicrobiales-6]
MTQRKDIDTMRRKRDVDGLVAALSDPAENVRLTAAEALGTVGDERALEALVRLKFSDSDTGVRRAASGAHARVVGRLADRKAAEGRT